MAESRAPASLCVYCRRHPVEAVWRPFCSQRCKLLDLAHWVDGDYRVAGEPMADEISLEAAAPDAEPAAPQAERAGSSNRRTR